MKVIVDEDICVGTANCVDVCPDVFELVDAISKVKVATVPEELFGEESAREAQHGGSRRRRAGQARQDCPRRRCCYH